MVTLEQAITMAARLIEDAEFLDWVNVMDVHDEYTRGMANILAELYPVIEMPHAERSDEIERRIVDLAVKD